MHSRRQVLRYAGSLAVLATGCANPNGSERTDLESLVDDPSAFPGTLRAEGRLIVPTSAEYTAARTVINPRIDVKPTYIAYCKDEREVAATMKWARANGRRVTVRSGGHSYEGASMNNDIVIDISNLKSFALGTDTMVIGAGWKQGELARRLFDARPNTGAVMGSCKTVGLSGFSLGGGFGFLSRKHGLGVDNIVSLTLVNAAGEIVVANDRENKELFWALRGGGAGNFGVVTSMEYRVHAVPPVVTTFYHKFTLDEASRIVPLWFQWIKDMAPEIVSIMSISGGGGSGSVAISGQFLGTADALMATARPDWGVPMEGWLRERSYLDAIDYFNGGASSSKESRWRARSDYYLKPLNNEGVDTIAKVLRAVGNPWAFAFLFDSYGPVIRAVPSDAMAFAHRKDILCCMQLYMSWGGTAMGPNAQDGNSAIRLRAIGDALKASGNVSGRAYPNYADSTRDDWPSAYYADNLARLSRAKQQFDPTHFFTFAQSLPPA